MVNSLAEPAAVIRGVGPSKHERGVKELDNDSPFIRPPSPFPHCIHTHTVMAAVLWDSIGDTENHYFQSIIQMNFVCA